MAAPLLILRLPPFDGPDFDWLPDPPGPGFVAILALVGLLCLAVVFLLT
jgi:hypothetical protein